MTDEIAYLLTGRKINKINKKSIVDFFQGPILFDTVNFSLNAGKTTEKDRQIFAQLQTFRHSSIDNSKLYSDLRGSSCDATGKKISIRIKKKVPKVPSLGLSVQDLLQKDAKQIVGPKFRLIMSSLPMNYTVEVNLRHIFSVKNFFFLEITWGIKYSE
jgi:inorganic pyrophosphatase/exopolyphosphatase